MRRRKQFIINKKFQLKMTFQSIGFLILVSAVGIGVIGADMVYNNSQIQRIYKSEDNVIQYLQYKLVEVSKTEIDKNAMKEIAVTHSGNLKEMLAIVKYNRILIILLVVLVFVSCVIMFATLIIKSHRISGPIYVMTRYINEIMEGKDPVIRQLRRHDDFKEFYALFCGMIEKFRKSKT
jgi:nitrogen fixation/metabolism regulation signal transduction histidine kinase